MQLLGGFIALTEMDVKDETRVCWLEASAHPVIQSDELAVEK
jgi:hypothetical protein